MPTTQIANPAQVEILDSYYPRRDDVGLAWSRAVSSRLFLPKTRGFWPFSLTNGDDDLLDAAGNSQTAANTGAVGLDLYGIAPHGLFSGANHFVISSAKPNTITGALTMACFFYTENLGAEQGLMSKWGAAGNRSYRLYVTSGNVITFSVSSNGTAITSVASTVTPTAGPWYCVIGEYIPFTRLTIWVNGVKTQNTTSIPAAIFDSTANLFLGNTNGSFLTGGMTLASLHASAINSALAMLIFDYARPLFAISV